jgi:hypothetical protein
MPEKDKAAARFARLPKWAQNELNVLRGTKDMLNKQVQALSGDGENTDVFWRTFYAYGETHGLPEDVHIVFKTGESEMDTIDICLAHVEGHHRPGRDVLISSGIRSLRVEPEASNSIRIYTADHHREREDK